MIYFIPPLREEWQLEIHEKEREFYPKNDFFLEGFL